MNHESFDRLAEALRSDGAGGDDANSHGSSLSCSVGGSSSSTSFELSAIDDEQSRSSSSSTPNLATAEAAAITDPQTSPKPISKLQSANMSSVTSTLVQPTLFGGSFPLLQSSRKELLHPPQRYFSSSLSVVSSTTTVATGSNWKVPNFVGLAASSRPPIVALQPAESLPYAEASSSSVADSIPKTEASPLLSGTSARLYGSLRSSNQSTDRAVVPPTLLAFLVGYPLAALVFTWFQPDIALAIVTWKTGPLMFSAEDATKSLVLISFVIWVSALTWTITAVLVRPSFHMNCPQWTTRGAHSPMTIDV
jgi:hypothetical protein